MIHTQCNARYEKLEKETQIKISNLEECVRIKDRQHIIRANDDFIIFENLRAQVNELQSENENLKSKVVECTMCQNLRAQVNELQSQNENLKSKVVECTMCQNLQVQVEELNELQSENENLKSKVVELQVEELKSVNESLNLSVEELSKARALAEATLRERDELIFAQCEKIRLLEEQCEPFYEVQSEFDLEKVHDTQDNSEKDLILSLQTQLKETAELVVHFSDEKYFALKEIESLKDEIKSLQIENQDLKSREFELNNLEKVYETKESVLLKDIVSLNLLSRTRKLGHSTIELRSLIS
ncbi:hypothetical protein Tco_0615352 [Tanacetum coccineum]